MIDSESNIKSRIEAALSEYGSLALSELVNLLAWTGTLRQLRVVLEHMRRTSRIELVGKGRGSKWRLIASNSR